jgi:predicted TPR repeat methyltransferase
MNAPSSTDGLTPAPAPSELTLEDALALARHLHREGQIDDARMLYERILSAAPRCAEAWHFLGLIKFRLQQPEAGIADVERALELDPDYGDAHANLGNMLIARNRIGPAESHLRRALALDSGAVPPRIALAMLCTARDRTQEAEALMREAIAIDPESAGAHCGLANALLRQGRVPEALDHYLRAIAIYPELTQARTTVGYALCRLGRVDEAAAHFRKMLEEDPENEEIQHRLAACGVGEVPERASDGCVRRSFDSYSASFDASLASLQYRAPELIQAALLRALGPEPRNLDVLDAGCGTGLLGALIKPYCRRLVGVDLSPGMLAKAAPRALYDQLEEAELTAWLGATALRFDVVASADTLCYFGALEAPLAAAYRALHPGGWLFFSVEQAPAGTPRYLLQHHGRYAHDESYVASAIRAAGFTEPRIVRDWLRTECGERVHGLVLAAHRPA